jgi:hypothetical protein
LKNFISPLLTKDHGEPTVNRCQANGSQTSVTSIEHGHRFKDVDCLNSISFSCPNFSIQSWPIHFSQEPIGRELKAIGSIHLGWSQTAGVCSCPGCSCPGCDSSSSCHKPSCSQKSSSYHDHPEVAPSSQKRHCTKISQIHGLKEQFSKPFFLPFTLSCK